MADTIAYLEAIIGADVTSFRRGMQEVRRSLFEIGGLGESLRGVGSAMTMALTVPLLAAGGAALKLRADFDQAMRNVNSMALLGEEQFQGLSAAVLEFGSTIRSGPIGAAEALYTVIGAGWTDVTEAMQISQIAARTAEAGLADMTVTTEGLVAALLSYGAGVEEAARYSDILTRMVQVGVGTMNEFGGSLSYVLPAASALNVPFEDVAATLAYLTQRGFSASRASTSLNNAFSKLIQPSEAMSALFEEMGVNSGRELIATFGGLQGALNAIFEATNGNEQALAALFPDERGRRAILLAATDLEQFNSVFDEFEANMNGATVAAWEEQSKSLAFQFDLLTAAVQGFAIKIGEQLEPMLLPIVTALKELFLAAQELDPELINLGLGFAGILAVAGPVLWVLGALLTPAALLTATIAALAAVFVLDIGGFRTGLQGLFDDIKDPALGYALSEVLFTFQQIIREITRPLSGIWDALTPPQAIYSNGIQITPIDDSTVWDRIAASLEQSLPILEARLRLLIPRLGRGLQNLITEAAGWVQREGLPALGGFALSIGTWITEELVPGLSYAAGSIAGKLSVMLGHAINLGIALLIAGGDTSQIDWASYGAYIDDNVIEQFTAGYNDALNGIDVDTLGGKTTATLGTIINVGMAGLGAVIKGISKGGGFGLNLITDEISRYFDALKGTGNPAADSEALANGVGRIGGAVVAFPLVTLGGIVAELANLVLGLAGTDISTGFAGWQVAFESINTILRVGFHDIISRLELEFQILKTEWDKKLLEFAESINSALVSLGLPPIDLTNLKANVSVSEVTLVDTAFANAIERAVLASGDGAVLDLSQLLTVEVNGETFNADILSALTAPGVYDQLTGYARDAIQRTLDDALARGDIEAYVDLAQVLVFNSVDDDFNINYDFLPALTDQLGKAFADNPITVNPKLKAGGEEGEASLLAEFQTLFAEGSELRLLISGFGDFYALEMADLTLQTTTNTMNVVTHFALLKSGITTAIEEIKTVLVKLPAIMFEALSNANKNITAFSQPIIGQLNAIKDAANSAAAAIGALGAVQVPGVSVGGGRGGNTRAYANGGAFPAGVPMIVGEQGPELIVPRTAGMVVPNGMSVDRNGRSGGGGSMVQYNNVYITARDTDQLIDELERRGIYLTRGTN